MSCYWKPEGQIPSFDSAGILKYCQSPRKSICLLEHPTLALLGIGIDSNQHSTKLDRDCLKVHATLPALYPEWLGGREFTEKHQLRFPYVAGEMARGIASVEMVTNMAKAGMLSFFGAAGLDINKVEQSIQQIRKNIADIKTPWGINLIHSPQELGLQSALVDLLISQDVRYMSASAFMDIGTDIVRYAAHGLSRNNNGDIKRKNHVFAKISHPSVAQAFLSPPPKAILQQLVAQARLTQAEATLAQQIPIASAITVEADSGGHTDSRSLSTLFPVIQNLRNKLTNQFTYEDNVSLGAAGGIGTPEAVAAAYALGANYVVTGSVNQTAIEANIDDQSRHMLAKANITDMALAPSADMFEIGAKVQVLKYGTMFSNHANQLQDLYKKYSSLDAIPIDIREKIEKNIFQNSLENIYQETRKYFAKNKPEEINKAEENPRYKMSLVFRWYLGNSSRWAVDGNTSRQTDYQLWCGPAMGAFNDWVKVSFLEPISNRSVVQIARNLLEGAACITRAQQLRSYGVAVPASAFNFTPRLLTDPAVDKVQKSVEPMETI